MSTDGLVCELENNGDLCRYLTSDQGYMDLRSADDPFGEPIRD